MSDSGSRTPERKVLSELSNTKTEPISPTVNLRLLTSLASNIKNATTDSAVQVNSSPLASGSTGLKLLPRKQKSLGLLCNKFLSLYPLDVDGTVPQEISLDGTARMLGTEKRRIYDIINVLESLEIASKAGKNRYLWHGQGNLARTLARLKSTAIRLGLRDQIQEIQKSNQAFCGNFEDSPDCTSEMTMVFEEQLEDDNNVDASIKEDKSLGAMCQKFIMLFLVSLRNGVINLDIAAKVLIIDSQPVEIVDNASRSRFKTKARRLYDIANVLTAIGLIKKVYMYDRAMKKPVFKYIGPDIESIEFNSETPTREMYNSPVGMSTPNRRAHTLPRATRAYPMIDQGSKTVLSSSSSTPINDRRKLRKRKLFNTDSGFMRTHSSPQLDGKSHSLDRLDDSILRVAEMELERLNSSEECKPKACKKLMVRYNSDSCIVKNQEQTRKAERKILPAVVVENSVAMPSNASGLTTLCLTPPDGLVSTSKVSFLPLTNQRIIKLLPIVSNPVISGTPSSSIAKITRYKIEPTMKQPKIINLANIDPKKLIPIKQSDLRIALAPTAAVENIASPNDAGFTKVTRIQSLTVAPGDTFKAVQVGNTLQLIPIKDIGNLNHEDHGKNSM